MKELKNAVPEQYICKYIGVTTLLLHVLPSKTIRLSPFKEMNDPRETNGGGFELEPAVSDTPPYSMSEKTEIESSFRQRYKNNSFVFCATLDKKTGSKEMKRGYGMPRMWAQYGDNHAGACLVFDRAKLQSLADRKFLKDCWYDRVDYDPLMLSAGVGAYTFNYEEYKSKGFEYFKQLATQYKEQLYFRKHTDWQGEQEWRIATLSEEGSNTGLLLPYEDALKYIVLGDRATENTIKAVRYMYSGNIHQLKYVQDKEDFLLTHPSE